MKKRFLAFALASAMVFTMAACGTSGGAATSAAGSAASTAAASTAASNAVSTAVSAATTSAASGTEAKAPKNGSKYVIGVSLPSPANQWVAAVIDNAQKQAEEANATGKFEVNCTTADNPSKQVSDVEDLLTKNPDAIVLFPIESAPLTTVAAEVKAAGIPLIVLTRGVESTNYDTYIRGDDKVVGISAANYIGEKLKGKGNVVLMKCSPSQCETDRTAGFTDTLTANYPDIKIIATGNGDFAREPAMSEMENILQANPKIDAVFSEDDEQALGCVQAIKDAGREKEMFVCGTGGNKAVLEEMINNPDSLIKATFFYSPLQGGSAVELAQLMAQGKGMDNLWEKTVPREIIFAADTITAENAAEYYDKNSQY